MPQEGSAFCFVPVALVRSTHGIQGEVVCEPAGDLPFVLEEGMRVLLLPPQFEFDRFTKVSSVREHKGNYLVCFEGLNTRQAAEVFACSPQARVLLSYQELKEWNFSQEELFGFQREAVLGIQIFKHEPGKNTSYQLLGVVEDYYPHALQSRLLVKTSDDMRLELPLADEFIERWEADKLYLALPQGLVEQLISLYQEGLQENFTAPDKDGVQ